jgi:hypothetical protein
VLPGFQGAVLHGLPAFANNHYQPRYGCFALTAAQQQAEQTAFLQGTLDHLLCDSEVLQHIEHTSANLSACMVSRHKPAKQQLGQSCTTNLGPGSLVELQLGAHRATNRL